jgi:NAD(P)-dependent dehydrogenase (short-subunit alcohol dehydrogenase family)
VIEMSLADAFMYQGKRALVVGGATGMGAAVAELVKDAGADVVVMDRAEVKLGGVKTIHLDLSDKGSIETASEEVEGPIHALFSCAGVADGTPGIERINFIGHRHLIDKLLSDQKLPRGSAIGMISSAAGLGWEANFEQLQDFLDITEFDEATLWISEHLKADYMFSKQAINAYVARVRFRLSLRGRYRCLNAVGTGLSARLLVQRRCVRGDGYNHGHRRRICQLGCHRVIPGRNSGGQLFARYLLILDGKRFRPR